MKEHDSLKGKFVGKLCKNKRGDIFAATSTGVYGTANRGLTWTFLGSIDMELGFLNMPIASIFAQSDDTLFICGYDQTLYRCVINPNSLHAETMPTALPQDYSLSQNYPNPFNGTTTIQFTLPKRSKVRLKIFNVLGNEMIQLVDDILPEGNYHNRWNAGCASGIYFCRLDIHPMDDPLQAHRIAKKMLFIK
ncbi:MAG: T9SS type A sorting domain-containing protein [Ignavibacteriales bacterium]|nr:T9SS type A sorting domain-containing protein [Ignavibacteriales bacterium]